MTSIPIVIFWVIGILLHRGWVKYQERRAQKYFDSLHGEKLDLTVIDAGDSLYFILHLVRLEKARKKKVQLGLVHAYHPSTPVTYLCGQKITEPIKVTFDEAKMTCEKCRMMEQLSPFGKRQRQARLVLLPPTRRE